MFPQTIAAYEGLIHWGRDKSLPFHSNIFRCIFLNENAWISLKISLKFVVKVRINNIPALVQIMAWHRPGDKPLSEPMMISLLMHICVTRPQWVNKILHATERTLWSVWLIPEYSVIARTSPAKMAINGSLLWLKPAIVHVGPGALSARACGQDVLLAC